MRIILIKVQFKRVRDMVCERRFYFYPSTCAKFDRVTPSSPGIIVCIVPRCAIVTVCGALFAFHARYAVFTRYIITIGTRRRARNYRTEPFFVARVARFTRNTVQYTYRFSRLPIDKQK